MVMFTPAAWKAQGEEVTRAADSFYRGADRVIIGKALAISSSSPIDAAILDGDNLCHDPWHQLIANGFEALTSVGSRMVGTGSDYKGTEDGAEASTRQFWSEG